MGAGDVLYGCGPVSVPETLSLVVQGACIAAGSSLVQLGQ